MNELEKNRVFAALPPEVRTAVAAAMKQETFAANHVLVEENSPITRAYFPVDGIISVVGATSEGGIAESYTAGSDGFFGVDLLLGASSIAQRATCQVPGTFYSMPAETFLQLTQRHDALMQAGLYYMHCVFTLTAQSAACNMLHGLTERLARWLLLVQDRVYSNDFILTQEILATMLGVHRPAVSVVAGSLQNAGLIKYKRGLMTITDRDELKNAACECYGVVAEVFDRFFPRA